MAQYTLQQFVDIIDTMEVGTHFRIGEIRGVRRAQNQFAFKPLGDEQKRKYVQIMMTLKRLNIESILV